MQIDISFNLKRALYVGGIILLIAVIVLYAYRTSRPLVQGVQLAVEYPPSDTTRFETPVIRIEGLSPKAKQLEINGNLIVMDESGRFSEPFVLMKGYNDITIRATDKYDKISAVHRTWFYSPPEPTYKTPSLPENLTTQEPSDALQDSENDIIETEEDNQTTSN